MKYTLKIFALAAMMVMGLAQGADASVIHYVANLSGPNESPPNASPGIGLADVFWDTSNLNMEVKISFSGLLGTTTASHIHCCTTVPFTGTAGVATVTPTFTGFPLGVTSGTYDFTYNMSLASSYNPAFVTANGGTAASAELAFFAGLDSGKSYLNIHTSVVGGGEIRGFLVRIPEPGSLALLLGGLAVLASGAFAARRVKRTA